ncbi:hypothetical protein PIB30_067924 [Stylosanthes scabra]|uniref:Uncharacterized protein n=1 Tax=Stylosanthes scabra TaxID=79078 RepID=A0ABU6SMT4_9FABA|nr:hypothetical protein [Stylosanthes scabra]
MLFLRSKNSSTLPFCSASLSTFSAGGFSSPSRRDFLFMRFSAVTHHRCKMVENLPEGQGAVVREVEGAQMPRELPTIYRWVTRDVLGSPPILNQEYLDELKLSRVIFGGGELERRYRVEAAARGIGFVAEPGFRCSVPAAPERLVGDSVFRVGDRVSGVTPRSGGFPYLFTFFSPNIEGKTKKGYMSVRPGKYRKIFGLYEDSFHDFKGRLFKIFFVGEYRPFWLSLEGQGRFPPYWSRDAGMEYVPVTYKGLTPDQKDTADILVKLFPSEF